GFWNRGIGLFGGGEVGLVRAVCRLQICDTAEYNSALRLRSGYAGLILVLGAARRVAQIFNLLYRRILFCQAQVISKVVEPVRRLRQVAGRLRLRAGNAGLLGS